MVQISVAGYPRIGPNRELKKLVEEYFKKNITKQELLCKSAELRKQQWRAQMQLGVNLIPSNDFSYYDTFLDTAFLLNIIPKRYRDLKLDTIDTYFAMAKGYQENGQDVKALPMKKWFTTNYHYLAPTIGDDTEIRLNGTKPFDEFLEALGLGIRTKPVLIGPFTFLKLCKIQGGKTCLDYAAELTAVYREIFCRFDRLGARYIQMDEPFLVTDLTKEDADFFVRLYKTLLQDKGGLKVLLQTYFGDIRDVYSQITALDFDAVGMDFVEGEKSLELIEQYGFPKDKILFAGVVNGRNIWRNDYARTLTLLNWLRDYVDADQLGLSTSCSLLHVPYTVKNETGMEEKYKRYFAFAEEKLEELRILSELLDNREFAFDRRYLESYTLAHSRQTDPALFYPEVRQRIDGLTEKDFTRTPAFDKRIAEQKKKLGLPLMPITTIGSFPQTAEVRALRKAYKTRSIDKKQYQSSLKVLIEKIIRLQEELGLDVLVHGEYERNDMVEYFGENLSGFLFTQNGWVQSYGTRCVKPPVIFGDVKRPEPITVEYITYAQSLTSKWVKGMLTGPVTILNWSFPREDLPLKEIAYQIALAIREEVLDLERQGIAIIQVDEAALREKLPLRKQDWHEKYLDWAIKAFRLVHSGVDEKTQIHTHMCYSEFEDIIQEIDAMDADVITFEAAKSDLYIIDVLRKNHFRTEVGPGVYDIHSPRVPEKEEIRQALIRMLEKLEPVKLWVNPDCGLKTRGERETGLALKNMVAAAEEVRNGIK